MLQSPCFVSRLDPFALETNSAKFQLYPMINGWVLGWLQILQRCMEYCVSVCLSGLVQVLYSLTLSMSRQSVITKYWHWTGISSCFNDFRHLPRGWNLHFWLEGSRWSLQPDADSKFADASSTNTNSSWLVIAGLQSSAYDAPPCRFLPVGQ